MASKYATKQRTAVLSYLQNNVDSHLSASDIQRGLFKTGHQMGLATIYRHLKNLEDEGLVISNKMEGVSWVTYRCNPSEGSELSSRFFLKCEDCGQVVNFKCEEISHLYKHLELDHQLKVNQNKTIFYGHCGCKSSIDENK
ncbi:Fur family transcriptional regulator [Eubacteriales bacterium KG127]